MTTEKRYQVFISSTYEDLVAEREVLSFAILRSNNIPSGMELASGANERTLDVIYRWIDDSDIFVLLVGGRYGSIDHGTGLSYTELEYNYAKAHHKPVIALYLTDMYLEQRVTLGAPRDSVFEIHHTDRLAAFKQRVSRDSFCILISDLRDLEPKVFAALDNVKATYSPQGWIRTTAVLADVLSLYARYCNTYLDILRNEIFSEREIEDLLRDLTEVIRRLVSTQLGWLDVMEPVTPSRADWPNLLIRGARSRRGWLKIVFSGIRRTKPPILIPVEVNGVPWRGSGNALLCGGIDYVSSFQGLYSDPDYQLSAEVTAKIEAQYAHWRREHYFSSLLAVAVLAPQASGSQAVGVLNLNFTAEDPLGTESALSPQRSTALLEVLEPALQVLALALTRRQPPKASQV